MSTTPVDPGSAVTAPGSGQLVVGCLVAAAGLLVAPLGCAGLLSGDPMGTAFGVVLGGSATLLLGSAVASLRQGWWALQAEQAERALVAREDPVGAAPSLQVEVVASWSVGADDWRRFNRDDLRERAPVAFGMGLGLAVLGSLMLAASRGVSLAFAFLFCAAFGSGIALLWLAWITRARWQPPPRIRVMRDAVYVGAVRHTLRSGHHRLDAARLDPGEPEVLVFTVSWDTRGGRQHDDVRVPVPAAHRADALRAVAELAG